MSKNSKSIQQILSFLLSLLLLLSLVFPSTALAVDGNNGSEETLSELELVKKLEAESAANDDKLKESEEVKDNPSLLSGLDWRPSFVEGEVPPKQDPSLPKVDSTVNEELNKAEFVNVIIYLKDQEDYNALHTNSTKKHKKNERAAFVKSQLESKANASQRGLKASLNSLSTKGHAKIKQSFWINNSIAATVDEVAIKELEQRKDVERIILDQVIQLPKITVESSKPRLPEWGLEKINATKVWGDYGLKGEGIVVGIMDTGVDGNHEALKDNYRGKNGGHQYSWIDLSGHQYQKPTDGNGHGTHVAGTAVGGGSGEPIGVAPEAEWIAAKIFSDGGATTTSTIHAAFEWFLAPGGDPSKAPDVVNNSWGNPNTYNTEFREDVKAWIAAGIFPLFAAGNDGPGGQTIGSPGSFLESFAVGATDSFDQIASFSSRGPVYWVNENGENIRYIKPDLSAPGHMIYSAWPTALGKGKYNTISGTSMATPHVAGAIALLLSANPEMTVDEIKDLLKRTVRTEPHMGTLPNDLFGEGIINIHQAVTEAAYAGELKGSITDQSGNPIPATIKIEREGLRFTNNEDGTFQYKVREGKYNVTVTAFGYKPLTTEVTIVKDDITTVNWKLESATVYSLDGTVVDEITQEPIPYAYIRLKGTPLPANRTNENGEFQIQHVPVGTYELQVTGEGIKGQTVKIDLQENKSITIEVSTVSHQGRSDWNTANNNTSRNAVSPNSIDIDHLKKGWQYNTGTKGDIVFSSPAATSNEVIAVTDLGWVISVNIRSGEENWSVRIGSTNRSSPTIEDGLIFISGGSDGTIYALDLETGRTVWSKTIGQPTVYEAPLYKDGVLFVGSGLTNQATLYALNAQTGEIIWNKKLGGDSYFGGALGDDYLVIGTYSDRTILALNPEDGSEIWKKTIEGYGFASKPVIYNNDVYINATNFDKGTGALYVFNGETGEVRWSTGNNGDPQAASPIIYDGIVIVSSSTQPILRAFDSKNGELLWENRVVGSAVNNGSVTSNGLLLVSGLSGYFFVLDIYTGEVVKDFSIPNVSYSSIPVIPGMVIVPYRNGIQAFVAEGIISGKMTDENGNPLHGKLEVLETKHEVTADEQGNYVLAHAPGEYTVKASLYGKKQQKEKVKFVSGYTTNREFVLEDATPGSFTLTVKDSRTKAPIEGVEFSVKDTPITGMTGDGGHYKHAEFFEGEYELSLKLNGYSLKSQVISIKPNVENSFEIELQPYDIAVLNDWKSEVTTLLNRNGFLAEERDWDVLDDLHRYQAIYLNGAYTTNGTPPSKETFEQLLTAAKENDVDLIFADAWGGNYGSIEQLHKYVGDPKDFSTYYGSGIVQMKADVEHPIFNGFEVGERITLYNRNGYFAWVNQYSGRHLGTIGNSEVGEKGSGVAYKPVSENSAHILLTSFAATPWISPLQGWSQDMQTILFNTMDYAKEAKFGLLTGEVKNAVGQPVDAEIEIVETTAQTKTSSEQPSFELFHDEGEYTLEVRSLGYKTVQMPITFENGVPIHQSIVLQSSEGGMVSGVITDANSGMPLNGAKVKLLLNEEMVAETVVQANGRFEFVNVSEGNYVIKVEAEGYLEVEQEVKFRGEPLSINLSMNPIPRVAVLYDNYSYNGSFARVLEERGIPVTPLTMGDFVERISEFDVVFINQMSTTNVKKENFEAMMEAADAAETSVIFGDSYYTDSPINQLKAFRGDPAVRGNATLSNTPASYVVDAEHPIFGEAQIGDTIEVLTPSKSNIGYFNDYSGYGLASIKHEGRNSYGLGIAYKPRTANSVELLMSGHSFSLAHDASHYTPEGKEMLIRAIMWSAFSQFPSIIGTVKDSEGNSLKATIKVVGESYSTESDQETGHFEVALLEGDYEVEISAYGYKTQVVPVRASLNANPIDVVMETDEKVSTLTGTVENEKDGIAIEGVEVKILNLGRSTTTNTQGQFEFSMLMPGTHQLQITKDGYVLKELEVDIEEKKNVPVKVRLKPSPTIGIIVDNTGTSYSLSDYLKQHGYHTLELFYTDLDKLDEVDLVIANSDYDNSKIPTREVFNAFQEALYEHDKSILWTGHVNGRGGIRFMNDYEGNPAIQGVISKAGIGAKVIADHPITAGIERDTLLEIPTRFNDYYYFDDYDGTTIAELEHPNDGRIGSLVAYNGRTNNSVEVLLANMTFSYNFHPGPGGNFDPVRERIFHNAITWALDNQVALVGEVHGQVMNDLGLPVQSTITVMETGKVVESDDKGKFYLGLPEGSYTLLVQGFGHIEKQFQIEIVNGESLQETFTVNAEDAGTIVGNVLDGQTEEPIAGATVSVLGTPLFAVTDSNGEYELAVPEGSYDVRATAPGYAAKVTPIEVTKGQESTNSFLLATSEKIAFLGLAGSGDRILPFLRAEGYEVDFVDYTQFEALEENIRDYSVVIFNNRSTRMSNDAFRQFVNTADENEVSIIFSSQFSGGTIADLVNVFGDPQALRYTFVPKSISVNVLHDHPLFAGIRSNEFTLLDKGKESLNQQYAIYEGYSGVTLANLTHYEKGELGAGIGFNYSSANSVHLLLSSMQVGSYSDPNSNWTPEAKMLYTNAIDWAMSASIGEVRGIVTDEEGNPIANAVVKIPSINQETKTNAKGEYRIGAGTGNYDVVVSARGFHELAKPIEILESGQTVELNFELAAIEGTSISGTITQNDTNEAIVGAKVLLKEEGKSDGLDETITDETGAFHFTQLLPGKYEVLVEANGYISSTQQVEVGEDGVELSIGLDAIVAAVIGDWNNKLVSFLNENQLYAEETGWDVLNSVTDFELIIVNTNKGTKEEMHQLIDTADENGISLVFLGSWASDGSIGLYKEAAGYPDLLNQGYNEGAVELQSVDGHPIFDGLPESVVIHSENSPYATFTNYPGQSLATITVDGEEKGASIGYEFRSADSIHLLLSSFAVTNIIGPDYGWTKEGEQLFLQSLRFAMNAKMESPSVPKWDHKKVHAKQRPILVTGQAEPNVTVHVYNGKGSAKTLLGSTKSNKDGSFQLELDLKNGSYSLFAQAETVAGVTDFSNELHLVVSIKANGNGKQDVDDMEEVELYEEAS